MTTAAMAAPPPHATMGRQRYGGSKSISEEDIVSALCVGAWWWVCGHHTFSCFGRPPGCYARTRSRLEGL